ncbi:MAG TPA: hypothetical protein VF828_02790 [Patescibacteria group bacterium]
MMLTNWWKIILIFVIVIFGLGVYQILYLKKAHSTFENYYAFRGCVQLVEKTQDYGICKTKTNQTIKIVKFDGRWFLDGDLPCKFFCI